MALIAADREIIDVEMPDDSASLAVITDWHDGSPTFKKAAAAAWIEMIRDNGWLWLGNGDLIENALRQSLGDIYAQEISPDEQVDSIVERLSPIKHLCIGMVSGNHGQRSMKQAGLDPDRHIARLLDVPYRQYTLHARIKLSDSNNTVWSVIAHHTTGGGRTSGAKLTALKRLAELCPTADLYIGGHSHSDLSASDRYQDFPGNQGGEICYRIRRFSGCGSLLDYGGSYAEAKMFPPASQCQVVHHLGGKVGRNKIREYDRRVYQF